MGQRPHDIADVAARLRQVADPMALLVGLFAHAPVAFQVYEANGRCLLVNQAFLDIFGSAPPPEYNVLEDDIAAERGVLELVRRAFRGETIAVPPVWYDPRELRQIAVEEGKRVAIEATFFPLVGPDGEIGHVAIAFRDRTAELTARAQLEESEGKFRRMVETAYEGIWTTDADTRVTFANRRMAEMLGTTPEAMLGRPAFDYVPASARELGLEQFQRRREGRRDQIEFPLRRADGSVVHTLMATSPIHDENGVFVGALAMVADITETRKLEEQVRQSVKMEALGRLAGGIAHDFNNLLSVIEGFASIIARRLPPNDPTRSDVEEIRKAADRAAVLTRQLLAFGRRQVFQTQVVDLSALLCDLEKMLRRVISEDIELDLRLGDSVRVEVDPGLLEQVVLNLVVNARDAMPRGGRLLVRTERVVASGVPNVRDGACVLLVVSDTGTGMEESVRERVFEPFFTTKPVGQGTGLGLSTVFGIVQQSNGHIVVESAPGRGTTFRIWFPATERPVASPTRRVPTVDLSGEETVLVVEDDPGVREYVRRALSHFGYQVLVAASGEEALRVVHQRSGPLDLLLTDVVMPRMNGRQLAEHLLRMLPSIKVLYMSGYAEATLQDALFSSGELLAKPPSIDDLARRVRQLLDRPR